MKSSNNIHLRQFKQKKWISLLATTCLLILGLSATITFNYPNKKLSSPTAEDDERPHLDKKLFKSQNVTNPTQLEPLTMHCNVGRLGNQMCTLAVLYALGNLNKREIRIPPCNYEMLQKYFDLDIPVLDSNNFHEKFPWNIKPYLEEKDKSIDVHSNIIKGYTYPCSFTFFNHIRHQIKTLFRFKPEIQEYAHNALLKARGDRTNVTFVGVHVRRTDYLGTDPNNWLHAFGGKSFDVEYFQKATDYYRKKYSNVLFVAVSDDRNWCKENLLQLGIYVTDDAPSPAHDMATLAICNHTIMTYGTFGFWSGYFAGGEVVYFDKFLKPDTEFTKNEFLFDKMYLPEWVGIETKSGHLE